MSKHQEEEFKQLLDNILASRQIPFDEKNWEAAGAMLDKAKRSKRRILYFALPITLLFIPALFYFYPFTKQTSKPASNQLIAASSPSININNPNHNTQPIAIHTKPNISGDTKPDTQEAVEKNSINEQEQAPATESNVSSKNSTAIQTTAQVAQAKENSVAINLMISPGEKEKKLPVSNVANVPLTFSLANKEKETKKQPDNIVPATTASSVLNQSDANSGINDTAKGFFPETTETSGITPNSVEKALPATTQTNSQDNEETLALKAIVESASVATTNAQLKTKSTEPLLLTQQPINSTLTATPAPEPTRTQTAIPDTAGNYLIPLPGQSLPKNMFIPEIGTQYNFGWNNENGRQGAGFSPVAGLHYMNGTFKKIATSIGVQYFFVSKMMDYSHTSKVTRYKFSEESDVTTITPYQVHYITIPVKGVYQFNKHNHFGAGYALSLLINVRSKVETYHLRIDGTQNYVQSTSYGYTGGFNTYLSQLNVFYRRRVWRKLWVNAEFNYGLSDLRQDAFFNRSGNERNSGIRLSLMYNVIVDKAK